MITKDAFDQWWQWADKPLESPLTIPTEIHDAVMTLTPAERRERAIVNEACAVAAVRCGRPAAPTKYGVPRAKE